MSDPFKIKLAATRHPVCFTAFDLLWLDGEDLTTRPLLERKDLFTEIVRVEAPPFQVPSGSEDAVWIEPYFVCTVQYMEKSKTGSLRQPVFKGLRNDKKPNECMLL